MNHTLLIIEQKVLDLLASGAVTQPTRQALYERLNKAHEQPRFFLPYYFDLLNIVCDRLVDQDPADRVVNIAALIDDRLAQGLGDGWRYNSMPPDGEMLLRGLAGIDETAEVMSKKAFKELKKIAQLEILQVVQQGRPPGQIWSRLPPQMFFEELLAETAEIYYSDPAVQLDIGYIGMADAYGWKNIGLNERDTID